MGGVENYENDTRGTRGAPATQGNAREARRGPEGARAQRCWPRGRRPHGESPACTSGRSSPLPPRVSARCLPPAACTGPTVLPAAPRGAGDGQAPSTRLLGSCTLPRLTRPGPQLCPLGQVHRLGPRSLAPPVTAQHHLSLLQFPSEVAYRYARSSYNQWYVNHYVIP